MNIIKSFFEWSKSTGFEEWVIGFTVFILSFFALSALKKLLFKVLQRWFAGFEDPARRYFPEALKKASPPFGFLVFISALYFAVEFAVPESSKAIRIVELLIKEGFVVFGIWISFRIVEVIFRSNVLPPTVHTNARTLLLTISRILIFFLGSLVILDTVGVSITPVLASLGVGSLAVALALQDTLKNFFSGLYIMADRPLRIGDYIRMDLNGTEGFVQRIGWRSTELQTSGGNTFLIPNASLASAQLMNYDYPYSETSISVNCTVAYESDLQKVEKTAIEVANAVMKEISGDSVENKASVLFQSFEDSGIRFAVSLRVRHIRFQGELRSAFIKAIHERFKKEKIEIPYPQRVVRQSEA